MSTKFRTCPYCGANLDHGEQCTCKDEPLHHVDAEPAPGAAQKATPDRPQPVLAPGA